MRKFIYDFNDGGYFCTILFLLSLILMFVICGCDDGSSGSQSQGQDVLSDAENLDAENVVSVVNVSESNADEFSEDFETISPTASVMAATSMAIESDEVYSAINASNPAPKPPVPSGIGNECVNKDIKVDSIVLNYDACQHAKGRITLLRQSVGNWLIYFMDDFSIFGVSIKGYVLLSRKSQGIFSFMSADSKGENTGVASLNVSWEGKRLSINRNIVLTGDLKSVDSPASYFHSSGDGVVKKVSEENLLDLGLGGVKGETKSNPIQFPRPVDSRCPHFGTISIRGEFSAKVNTVLSFEVAKQIYKLAVELGTFVANATINVGFDFTKADKLGDLNVFATMPVKVNGELVSGEYQIPSDSILNALSKANIADNAKSAIESYVKSKKIIIEKPEKLFEDAIKKTYPEQYLKDFCKM